MQVIAAVARSACRGIFQSIEHAVSFQTLAIRNASTSSRLLKEPTKATEGLPEHDFDHATGIERAELEGLKKGVDIFHEDWITAPFAGTPEDPVVVRSAFDERIVGVPDPEDDCLVIWDSIKAGEPPKQIIEGGEYFVLQRSDPEAWTAIPESFKGEGGHH